MSNIQKQHKISPAITWLTIQKFIIFYCPLDGEHTSVPGETFFIRNHGDRNGGHLIGYGGLISVSVAQ